MTYPNVADISSAQGSFDAAAYATSGRVAIIIKATEHLTYVNPFYQEWRDAAHQHGLITGEYHYMGDSQRDILGTPDDEAHHFLDVVGDHTPGRFAVCDIESATKIGARYLYGMSVQQAADWGARFLQVCTQERGWPDLAYSMAGSGVLQRLVSPYPRWYAAYPGPVPADRALHQFASSSPVPGVGNCDDSYCYIDLAAFSQGSVSPSNVWTFEEEPMSYPKPVPADGKAHSIPVVPPHAGACQGGYGNVWFGGSWDDLNTPINATMKVRVIGIKFDFSTYPVFGNNEVDLHKTREAAALADGTASVSVTIVDDYAKKNALEWVPMIESEVKGVPAK